MSGGRRVVVVGAGISGLSAAWRLCQGGAQVLLLEGRDRVGGVLHRGLVARPVEPGAVMGPVIDLGAESLLARRPEALALAHEVGLGAELEAPVTTRAAIYSRGGLHPMPRGHLMGVPGVAESVAGLLTEAEVDRLAHGLAAPGAPTAGDLSVGEWLRARLGPAVVDRLVEPLLGGVYAGRVDRLSVRATLPALAAALTDGRPLGPEVQALTARSSAAGPVFTGIRGGVARLADATEAAILSAGGQVRRGAQVTALERLDGAGVGRWRVGIGPEGRQEWVDAAAVVLALPAPATARLLAHVDQTASVATELAGVEVSSMALVAASVAAGSLPSDLSGVLIPAVEERLVKAVTFSSSKWGWARESAGAVHSAAAVSGGRGGPADQRRAPDVLRLSVGRAGAATDLHRSDDDLTSAALAEASELIDRDLTSIASRVVRWGGGLPQYDVGHLDRVARARDTLAEVPGLECCGSVWDGVGVAACIATATTAAARTLTTLH